MNKIQLAALVVIGSLALVGCPQAVKPPATPTPTTEVAVPSIWFTQVEKGSDKIAAHINFANADPHKMQTGSIADNDAIAYVGYMMWETEPAQDKKEAINDVTTNAGTTTLEAAFSSEGKWRGNFYLISKLGKFAWLNLGSPAQPKFDTWYGGNAKLIVDDGEGNAVIQFDKSSYTEVTPQGNEGEGEAAVYTISVNCLPNDGGKVRQVPNENWDTAINTSSSLEITTATYEVKAENGYEFLGWSGGASGNANPLTVQAKADLKIVAVFTQTEAPQVGEGEGEEDDNRLPGVRELAKEPVKIGYFKANSGFSVVADVAIAETTDGFVAFVADQGWAEVQIVDISDPANPQQIDAITVNNPRLVRYYEGYLYIVSGDMVLVYSLETGDWTNGSYMGETAGNGIRDLEAYGDYLYISGGNALETVDISDKDNLSAAGRIEVGCGAIEIDQNNSYLYLATDQGVNAYDLSSHTENGPMLAAQADFLDESSVAVEVAINNDGSRVAVGDNNGGVHILDVWNNDSGLVVNQIAVENVVTSLAWYNDYLYVGQMSSFVVIDTADPELGQVSEVSVGGYMLTSMKRFARYLFTCNSSSLKIYDLLEPVLEQ